MTQHRDQSAATIDAPESAPPRPKLEISATTITTGVVASTASAMLGSTLGVAGTLVGAALGAIAYSVVAALYSHSVATAKYRVQELRGRAERGAPTGRTEPAARPAGSATATDAADTAEWAIVESRSKAVESDAAQIRRNSAVRASAVSRAGGGNWRAVLAGALGAAFAFALALLLVTGIESFRGAPLSGGTAGSLTVFGGSSHGDPAAAQSSGVGDARPGTATSNVPTSTAVTHPSTATATETATQTSTQTATETATETSIATETAIVTTTQPAPATSPAAPSTANSVPEAPTPEPGAVDPTAADAAASTPAP